jgi:hypothetical protein
MEAEMQQDRAFQSPRGEDLGCYMESIINQQIEMENIRYRRLETIILEVLRRQIGTQSMTSD